MNPRLTLLVIHPCELAEGYLEDCLRTLSEWNAEGLQQTEIIVILQKESPELVKICRNYAVRWKRVAQDYAANDYPIWDVLSELRQTQSWINGQYVCVMHSEFIWCKDRLQSTINWLTEHCPYLALGNLRRPGTMIDMVQKEHPGCNKELSERMTRAIHDASGFRYWYDWNDAAWLFETVPTMWWLYWTEHPTPGKTKWMEDIFFANWEWLQSWGAFDHGGRLPFQDIYDLIGASATILDNLHLMPEIHRMSVETNRVVHLWHPKQWASWTTEVRDWFLMHVDEWAGTAFADVKRWDAVIRNRTDWKPVADFRQGPNGTITRYGVELKKWLSQGGAEQMQQFYKMHGQRVRMDLIEKGAA